MKILFLYILLFVSIQSNAQCWTKIAAGNNTSIAISNSGNLVNWGWTNQGISSPFPTYSNSPIYRGSESDWNYISKGSDRHYVIKQNGTLWYWGSNLYGSAGNGSNQPLWYPFITQIGTDQNWKIVSVAGYCVYAIKTDGTLWAWGVNHKGQLGNGTYNDSYYPIQIGSDNDWADISSDYTHAIALKTNGTLWSWGRNESGVLGLSSVPVDQNATSPIQIGSSTDWESVSTYWFSTLALKSDGTLWNWGLINGINVTTPTQIGNDTDWNKISVGTNHNLALKLDGTLWSWGKNEYGQLGNGTNIDNYTPIQIDSNVWSIISAGGYNSLAVKDDGSLWSWGNNISGQLGDGTNFSRNTPTLVNCPSLNIPSSEILGKNIFTPNPAHDMIEISEELHLSGYELITIADMQSKNVYQTTQNVRNINLEQLSAGIYLFSIKSKTGSVYRQKLIKN